MIWAGRRGGSSGEKARAWLGRQMMEEGEGRNEAGKGGRRSLATAAASAAGFVAVIGCHWPREKKRKVVISKDINKYENKIK